MIHEIMSNLDWLYLALVTWGAWQTGNKNISNWYFKLGGSAIGIIFGAYISAYGIIFWNIVFVFTSIVGLYKWGKNESKI